VARPAAGPRGEGAGDRERPVVLTAAVGSGS
jgi:hypothetical protein